jgi:large subunit ribosomal protein L4e
MNVHVYSAEGKQVKELELPNIFEEDFRPGIIKRAFLVARSARVQPWAPDERAGKKTSAETWGKGHGVARVRRVKGRRSPAAGRGAFAPFTTGGRRAHPPKTEKKLRERINKKERRLAIRSAIAATKDKKLVGSRGHVVDKVKELPLVVVDDFEKINKSKQARGVLEKLGLWQDVERVAGSRKIRAGRGKMRGRRYRRAVGPLLVISEDHGVRRAMRNLPGIDVIYVNNLNAEQLAPGGDPSRLTLWTESAIKKLAGGMFS